MRPFWPYLRLIAIIYGTKAENRGRLVHRCAPMSSNGRDRSSMQRWPFMRRGMPAWAALLALLSAGSSAALPSGSETAVQSLSLCERADSMPSEQRAAALAHGIKLAEKAIAADERDALAHFATVCNLGKQM